MKLKVKWYVTKRPFQNFPSAINSLDWEENRTYHRRIGEQWPAERKYNGLWTMPGMAGGHFCGTADNFLNGAPFLTEPVDLDQDGIPTCCNRELIGFATAGASASSSLTVVFPLDGRAYAGAFAASSFTASYLFTSSAFAGAFAASSFVEVFPLDGAASAGAFAASSLVRVLPLDGAASAGAFAASLVGEVFPLDGAASAGAFAASSFAGTFLMDGTASAGAFGAGTLDLVSPPPPPPPPATAGTSCATAGTMTLGVPVVVPVPNTGTTLWLRYPVTSGTQYHVTASAMSNIGSVQVYPAGTCSSLGSPASLFFNGCSSFVAASTGFAYITITPGIMSAGTVTLVADTGGC